MRRVAVALVALVALLASVVATAQTNRQCGAPGNPQPCSSETVCARSDVMHCEDWEDGNHTGWTWVQSWDDCTDIASTGGYNSPNAYKHRLATICGDCSYPDIGTNITPAQQTYYMRARVKFSSNYQFKDGSVSTGFQKLFYPYISSSPTHRTMVGVRSNGADTARGQLGSDAVGHIVLPFNQGGAEPLIERGTWYCIESRTTLSSPGNANGRVQLWLNDVLHSDYPNINLNVTSSPIERFAYLSNFYGGTPCGPAFPPMDIWFDDIVVATERIGCGGAEIPVACNDGVDNDGDTAIDHSSLPSAIPFGVGDAGCSTTDDTTENACGNGVTEAGEQCDCGGDACTLGELNNKTCASPEVAMSGGVLSCHATTCQFVTTGCFEQCAPYVAALSVFDVSTQALGYEAVKAIDLHTSTSSAAAATFWHNIYPGNGCTFPNCPSQPHCIDIDLNATTSVCGFQYTGRGDGACNGTFRDWQLWTCSTEACALSNDASVCGDTATPGNQWSLRASGSWPFTLATQERQFGTALAPVAYSARYARLRTTNSWGGGGCSSSSGDSNVGDVRFFADVGVAATPCHVLTAETASGGFTTGSNLDLALVGNCGASTGAVEVGDSATYATATKLTQVVTEWTAVNAKATGVLGAWPCDTQLYVFATPNAGAPTTAYPVVACGKLGAAVGGADVFVN